MHDIHKHWHLVLDENYIEAPTLDTTQQQVRDPPFSTARGRPRGSQNRSRNIPLSSTQRDPSAFEIVEASRRLCGFCSRPGHDRRTCELRNVQMPSQTPVPSGTVDDGYSQPWFVPSYNPLDAPLMPFHGLPALQPRFDYPPQSGHPVQGPSVGYSLPPMASMAGGNLPMGAPGH
ncbi:hypothetical protein SAICODRAFT_189461 [Saitoella complicata NRRL Y-17804]|uniref:uncharacterized protein n=1 Tax=Saitoella complicata (strain BCRC 22490 / CBS 7301 / JCM 7358 / NBRC 10748 / NRRL Y-17804) TaxID=698492 RepID=UPI0008673139|nr:uncharacterized protein SAICODRAFT_189461 [Saitoella complicata NRRL Y-17804]ODQ49761.1 hypothetical protein SAICODRAFT_189461 [Saitoella complicata NRRL Y-17804]